MANILTNEQKLNYAKWVVPGQSPVASPEAATASQSVNPNIDATSGQIADIRAKTAVIAPQVQAIGANQLQPGQLIKLPEKPADKENYPAIIAGGNAAIDFYSKKNETAKTSNDPATELFTKYLGTDTAPTDPMDNFNKLYSAVGIDENTKKLNDVNAQIADINAKVQASNLALESDAAKSGEVTTSFLGRQQAEQNRQAAIKILPLQAQALGLQGSLEAAREKLNLVFKIQSDYEDKLYNYHKDLRDKVYNFASKEQQAKLDAQQKKDDQDFQLFRDAQADKQAISKQAFDNGDIATASKISALDPKSKTYAADLAVLQAKIAPDPAKALDIQYKRAQLQGQYLDNKKAQKALEGTDNQDFNSFSEEQIALSAIPTQLRNSDTELKRYLEGIRAGLKEGKTPYEVADNLIGYKISKPDDFSNSIRQYISLANLDNQEIGNVARLVNAGDKEGALTVIENKVLDTQKKLDPDSYVGEATPKYYTQKVAEIKKLITDSKIKELGTVGGSVGQLLDKVPWWKRGEYSQLKSKVTSLVAEMRNHLSGTAVTESEKEFLEPLISSLNDKEGIFTNKLDEIKDNSLMRYNVTRSSGGLPTVDESQLLEKSERINAYLKQTEQENNMTDEEAYQEYLKTQQ